MTPFHTARALALLLAWTACASLPDADSYGGMYTSLAGVIELHRGPEGAWRGYMRTGDRIAALAPVELRDGVLEASATYDDGTRAELRATLMPGPVLVLDDREYRRSAVERPADATVRREIEEAYDRLAAAVDTKDHAAFQALRVAEFATIPPDGVPSPGSRMAERARGLLERIQPPITTTNDILELTVRGDDAIATVRQKFTRMQLIEGKPHTIHTEVTQRETWTRTPQGWKLLFVDEVRDALTLDDGRRVN
jgi:ketosteroid isomerase-like protein